MAPKKKSQNAASEQPLSLLKQLASKPEKLFSGAFPQQYGALCFRYNDDRDVEILLVTSRDTGRWIIPKGWPMKGKKPHEAAAVEAWEEAGVRGRGQKTAIGRYTYLKLLDDGDVTPCIVDVFEIEVSKVSGNFKERGERTLAWVSPGEAARRVREIGLKSLLVEFKPAGKQ